MELGIKVKAIRLEEEYSQAAMAQLIDIPLISYQNYEQGKTTINEKNLIKITQNPLLEKYALWLVTGKAAPESGQICPAFSIQEQLGIIDKGVEKRA